VLAKIWREWNPHALLMRTPTVAAALESSMEVPQKTKNRNTIQSSNSTAGYLFKENENINL